LLAPRLLRRAAGGVALDEEQLGLLEVLVRAVGELAGQRGARRHLLALHLLGEALAPHGTVDGELGDALGELSVLIEPQREGVLGDARDERRCLARDEALLR